MQKFQGIGVAKGIVIAAVYLLQRDQLEVTIRQTSPDQSKAEARRYQQAIVSARDELKRIRKKIPPTTQPDILAFIDTHLLMLEDAAFVTAPLELIHRDAYSAESALQIQRDQLVNIFDEMDDSYLRTRKDDVDHVANLIMKGLTAQHDDEMHDQLAGKIVLAQDLSPADTILMKHQGITGFITEFGGSMSHTAILARSLGIPAIVGLHDATSQLKHGDLIIIDGSTGELISAPDGTTIAHYNRLIQQAKSHTESLASLVGKASTTADGLSLKLMANIELPEDIETTRSMQADGVGLYRTEFLYMNRDTPPDEDEHYSAYRLVVEGLKGIPVTIRTLDLGADKQIDHSSGSTPVNNPALGLRAIRLCLKQPALFQPQLRAILRASVHGPVRIMIPMLSTLDEIRSVRQQLSQTMQELRSEGIPFDPEIPLGGMIEIPAAALIADSFAQTLDFLSIGTNDLIQYTLAIDRVDDEVNYLFNPLHPSVLQLIKSVIDAGHRHHKPVSMCGEMAGDARYIPLLLGMGLTEFSMQPGALLDAKDLLRRLNAAELNRKTRRLLEHLQSEQFEQLLSQLCPE